MSNIENSIYTGFLVHRIKEIYFALNEDLLVDFKPGKIAFEIGQTIGANEERKLLNLTIRVFLHYGDSESVITDIKVQNVFFVPELNDFINKDRLKLPSDIIVSMVSVSIAHTRALLAKNLAGTSLENTLLPVVNPLNLSQEFFPNLFNEKGLTKSKPRTKRTPASKK